MDDFDCYVPFFKVVTLGLDLEGYFPTFALPYATIASKIEISTSNIKHDIRRNFKWQKRK